MKLLLKLLIFIVILACAAPLFLKDPSGNALFSLDKINTPDLPSFSDIKHKSNQLLNSRTSQKKSKTETLQVYKWIDKKGVTHYSEKKDDRSQGQLVEIEPISILPIHQSEIIEKIETPDRPISVTTIPLQNVSKLIDDTRQVKEIMENRENQLNNALNY